MASTPLQGSPGLPRWYVHPSAWASLAGTGPCAHTGRPRVSGQSGAEAVGGSPEGTDPHRRARPRGSGTSGCVWVTATHFTQGRAPSELRPLTAHDSGVWGDRGPQARPPPPRPGGEAWNREGQAQLRPLTPPATSGGSRRAGLRPRLQEPWALWARRPLPGTKAAQAFITGNYPGLQSHGQGWLQLNAPFGSWAGGGREGPAGGRGSGSGPGVAGGPGRGSRYRTALSLSGFYFHTWRPRCRHLAG